MNNYDFAREELRIKDKTISDYKSQVENDSVIKKNKDVEILNLEILNNDLSETQKVQDDVLKDTKEQLEAEKNKNLLYKIGVPAAAVLGFVGGVLIAN